MDPADFVLRQFAKTERPEIDVLVEVAADVVESWPEDPARAQEAAARYGVD
jgi:peptidyl-tRNA hydrolase